MPGETKHIIRSFESIRFPLETLYPRVSPGGWIVIELNGAVEFTSEYQPGGDVFDEQETRLVA